VKSKKLTNQSLGEEIANAISHGLGAILSIVGMILMILKAKSTEAMVGVILFASCAFLLYLMSCLYHSFKRESKVKRVFRRFDYASIYLLIGGTYLPIFLIVFDQPWDLILITIQWVVIVTGITLKSVHFYKYKAVHMALYLILGWSGIFIFKPLLDLSLSAFMFILFGGISYTIGTIFYGLKNVKYAHFIWHLFVLGGTVLHFLAIYLFLL